MSVALCRGRMFEGKLGVSRLIDLYDERHSSFRAAKRERFPGVLVRDRVNVLEIGVRTALDDAAPKLGFLVRIVEVDDGESDPRIPFSEPSPVQMRMRPPSRPTHTGTLCGEPSGSSVARWAKLGPSTKAFISLESGVAIKTNLVRELEQI